MTNLTLSFETVRTVSVLPCRKRLVEADSFHQESHMTKVKMEFCHVTQFFFFYHKLLHKPQKFCNMQVELQFVQMHRDSDCDLFSIKFQIQKNMSNQSKYLGHLTTFDEISPKCCEIQSRSFVIQNGFLENFVGIFNFVFNFTIKLPFQTVKSVIQTLERRI